MGNVESRPHGRSTIEGPYKTARPLPPLPDDDDDDTIEDEYDLDSPPPYPPPPPPTEENGGKGKRVSWRIRDSNIFGGFKKGSWALHAQPTNEFYRSVDDGHNTSQSISDRNLSNTIATEDNSVITVSVIGTPDKDELKSSWKSSSDSMSKTTNGHPKDSAQSSWTVKNMQLIMDKEMQGNEMVTEPPFELNKGSFKKDVKHYPYPDVQTHPENEISSLPDLVSVKNDSNSVKESKICDSKRLDSKLPYALRMNEINFSANAERHSSKRVEDIRLDYPEGKTKEISHYNEAETSAILINDDLKPESSDINVESEPESDAIAADMKIETVKSTKAKKTKFGSCFGKPKSNETIVPKNSVETKVNENLDIPLNVQASSACYTGSKTELHTNTSIENEPPKLTLDNDGKTSKKNKKSKLNTCFSSSSSLEADSSKHSSTDKLQSCQYIEDTSNSIENDDKRKSQDQISISKVKTPKSRNVTLGSCFGKRKSEDLGISKSETSTDNLKDERIKLKVEPGLSELETESKGDSVDIASGSATLFSSSKSAGNDNYNEVNISLGDVDMKVENNLELCAVPKNKLELQGGAAVVSKEIDISFVTPNVSESKNKLISYETSFKEKLQQEEAKSEDLAIHYKEERGSLGVEYTDVQTELKVTDLPQVDLKEAAEDKPSKVEIDTEGNVNLEHLQINADSTKTTGKGGFKFGSCFGKKNLDNKQQSDVKDSTLKENVKTETKDDKIKITGKLDVPEVKLDTEINEPSFDASSPKKKNKLGLRFEKNEDLDVAVEDPRISIKSDTRAEVSLKKGTGAEIKFPEKPGSPNTKKKNKSKLGSCFGKKREIDFDENININEESTRKIKTSNAAISSINAEENIKGSIPDVSLKSKLRTDENDEFPIIATVSPEVSGNLPDIELNKTDINIEGKVPHLILDKTENIDVEMLKFKTENDTKLSLKVMPTDFEGNLDISFPEVKTDMGEFSNIPKIEGNTEIKGNLPTFESAVIVQDSPEYKGDVTLEIIETDLTSDVAKADIPQINVNAKADVKAEIKPPVVEVSSDIHVSEATADVKENIPSLTIKGDTSLPKKKAKLGSCFGKSNDTDNTFEEPSVTVESDVNADPSLRLDLKPEVNLSKTSQPSDVKKKKKTKFGSCFGKKPKTEIEGKVNFDTSIEAVPPKAEVPVPDVPSVSTERNVNSYIPNVSLKAELEADKEIHVPSVPLDSMMIDVNSTNIDFDMTNINNEGKVPQLKFSADRSSELQLPYDGAENEFDLSGKIRPINVESNNDNETSKIKIDAGGFPEIPKFEIESELECEMINTEENVILPDLPEIECDISVEGPNVETPKMEIALASDFLEADTPETATETELTAKVPVLKTAKRKEKKIKGGPCSCLGKTTTPDKTEPYLPAAVSDIKAESPEVSCKVTKPSFSEEEVKIETSSECKDAVAPSRKSKYGIGSCFGKPKEPKVKVDTPDVEIKTPKCEVIIPESGTAATSSDEGSKGSKRLKKEKASLPSCFGKKKDKINVEIKPPVVEASSSIEVDNRLDTSIEGSKIEIACVESKTKKDEKRKLKLASCFGKSRTPDLTADDPKHKVLVESPKTEVQAPSEEIGYSSDIKSPNVEIIAPKEERQESVDLLKCKTNPSIKSKVGIGSCFGKKHRSKVEILDDGNNVNVNDSLFEGSASIQVPTSDATVEGENPDIKLKESGKKQKTKLGSCFGKGKSSSLDDRAKPGELKASIDVEGPDIHSVEKKTELEGSVEGKPLKVDTSVEGDINAETLEIKGELPKISDKGGFNFGSCFGKKNLDKRQKISLKTTTLEADVKCEAKLPAVVVPGDIDVPEAVIDVKENEPSLAIKGDASLPKRKAKLGSCFGKSKNTDKTFQEPSISKKEEVEADTSLKVEFKPEVKVSETIHCPDVKKKKETKLGSCFGKKSKSKIDKKAADEVSVVGVVPTAEAIVPDVPSVSVEGNIKPSIPDASLKAELGVQENLGIPSISLEPTQIEVNRTDVDFVVNEIGLAGEQSVELKFPNVEVEDEFDLSVKAKDINVERNIDIAIPEIKTDVGVNPEIPKSESEVKLDFAIPNLEGRANTAENLEYQVDIFSVLPNVETPKIEAGLVSDIPKVGIPETTTEVHMKGEIPFVKTPKQKGKKIKGGPCSCLGKPKTSEISEPYYPTAASDIKVESPEVSGKVTESSLSKEGVKVEASATYKDTVVPSGKSKYSIASCFGKPKEPKIKVDTPETEIKSPECKVIVPESGAEVTLEISPEGEGKESRQTGKGKASLSSCFGKTKDKGDVEIMQPKVKALSSTEVDTGLAASVEGSKIKGTGLESKAKADGKKKLKLTSCFGKGKTPEHKLSSEKPEVAVVETSKVDVQASSEVGCSLDIKSSNVEIHTPKGELEGSVDLTENRNKPSIKSKMGIGSCFGKKPKGKVGNLEDSRDINVSGPSLEASASVNVPVSDATVSGERPDIKLKGSEKKQKVKLGSCFGKGKSPDLDDKTKSGELKASIGVETPHIETKGMSAELEGSVESKPLKIDTTVEGDINVETPEIQGETQKKAEKGRFTFGSCFGKKNLARKQTSLDKATAVEVDVISEIKSSSVEVSGEIDVPEVNVDVKESEPSLTIKSDASLPKKKAKTKISSCFGKSKDTNGTFREPSVSIKGDLETDPSMKMECRSEAKIPEPSQPYSIKKKKKTKLGSCFGKKPKTEIDEKVDFDVPVEGLVPKTDTTIPDISSINIERNVKASIHDASLKDELGVDEKADIHAISLEPKTIEITQKNIDFGLSDINLEGKVPQLELLTNKNSEPEMPFAGVENDFDLFVKTKPINVQSNIDIETPKIKIDAGEFPEIPKLESEAKLECEMPILEGSLILPDPLEFSGDISLKDPKVETPKLELAFPTDIPKIDIPDTETEIELKGNIPASKAAKLKEKKIKLGPCSCLGKSKRPDKSEPYLPTAASDIKVESPEVSCKVTESSLPKEGIKIETSSACKDTVIPSGKSKYSIGSCIGKPKEPKIKVDTPETEIKSPECKVTIPESGAEVTLEISPEGEGKESRQKGKGKASLSSCFGKTKDKDDVEIKQPELKAASSIEVDTGLATSVEGSKIKGTALESKAKADGKKKIKLTSCFGKGKTPEPKLGNDKPEVAVADTSKVGVQASSEVGCSSDIKSSNVEILTPKGELEGSINFTENRSKPSIKSKMGIGSCFGKKPSGKVGNLENSGGINVSGASLEASASVNVPVSDASVSGVSPDIILKRSEKKQKAKLGSCFGKGKSPDLDVQAKSGELKASIDFEAPDTETKGINIEVEKSIESKPLKIDTHVEGDINVETPDIKAETQKMSEKGDFSFGSCFGKKNLNKKQEPALKTTPLEVDIKGKTESPSEAISVDTDVPEASIEMKENEPSLTIKEDASLPKKKAKTKFKSCFGKSKDTDGTFKEPSGCIKGDVKADPSLKLEFQNPDAKKKNKTKLGSCFGKKHKTETDGKVDFDVSVEGVAPKAEITVPDIPSVNAEEYIKSSSPDVLTMVDLEADETLDVPTISLEFKTIEVNPFNIDFGFTDIGIEGKSPHLEISADGSGEHLTKSVEIENEFDILGKTEPADVENSIYTKTPKIKMDVGDYPEDYTLESEANLKCELPNLEGKIIIPEPSACTDDISLELPKVETPKMEVTLAKDIPKADMPELKVETKLREDVPVIKTPTHKGKNKISGPCLCLGKSPTSHKAEPYLPTAVSDINVESSGVSCKVPEPSLSIDDVKTETGVECKNAVVRSHRSKCSIGLCFGKPKETNINVDIPESKIKMPEYNIPTPESSAEATLDISSPDNEADSKIRSDKRKVSLSSCFGKKKGNRDGKMEHPSIQVAPSIGVDTRSDSSAEESNMEVEVVETQAEKDKKRKLNLGACFGKDKTLDHKLDHDKRGVVLETPKVEVQAISEVGCSSDIKPQNVEIHTQKRELEGSIQLSESKSKPMRSKMEIGSCFGKKPKTKIENLDGTRNVNVSAPSHEGSAVNVPVSDETVSGEILDVKLKTPEKKQKLKLGSCFGKGKSPDLEVQAKSGELEASADVKIPEKETAGRKLELEGSVESKSLKKDINIEGDIKVEIPEIKGEPQKMHGKGGFNFGSCFGKSNLDTKQKSSGTATSLEEDVKDNTKPLAVAVSGDIDVPEAKIEVKERDPSLIIKSDAALPKKKMKIGSCFGKNKDADVPCEEPSVSLKEDVEVDPTLKTYCKPEVKIPETSQSTNAKKETKIKFGSCFKKPKTETDLNADLNVPVEVVAPKADITIPDVSSIDAEKSMKSLIPDTSVLVKLEANEKLEVPNVSLESENLEANLTTDIALEGNLSQLELPTGSSDEFKMVNAEIENEYDSSIKPLPTYEKDVEVDVVVKENEPPLEIKGSASVPKRKAKLGSCFGKRKGVDGTFGDPSVSIKGDVKVDPSLQIDSKSENKLAEISQSHGAKNKNKNKFSSCFGKDAKRDNDEKDGFDILAEGKSPKSEINIPAVPSVGVEENVKCCILDDSPSDKLEADKNTKISTVLPASEKIKVENINLDCEITYITMEGKVPPFELTCIGSEDLAKVATEIENELNSSVKNFPYNVESKIEIESPKVKMDMQEFPEIPELESEVKLDNEINFEKKVSIPELSECLFSEIPKVKTPTIEVNVTSELHKADAPPIKVDPKIEGKVLGVTNKKPKGWKINGGPCSCLGKSPKNCDGDIYQPSVHYNTDDIKNKDQTNSNVTELNIGENVSSNCNIDLNIDISDLALHSVNTKDSNMIEGKGTLEGLESLQNKVFAEGSDLSSPDSEIFARDLLHISCNQEIATYENIPGINNGTSEYATSKDTHNELNLECSELKTSNYSPVLLRKSLDLKNLPEIGTQVSSEEMPYKLRINEHLKDNNVQFPDQSETELRNELYSNDIPENDGAGLPFELRIRDDEPPRVPKRWYGLEIQNIEDKTKEIPSVKSQTEQTSNIGIGSCNSDKVELLIKKFIEFDEENFTSQPKVKRTVRVKTYKTKDSSDEPEEILEEFEVEGEEFKSDVPELILRKLADLDIEKNKLQPIVKRTVKVKTLKTSEGIDDPEEIIEEFEDDSEVPFGHSELRKQNLPEVEVGYALSAPIVVKRKVRVQDYSSDVIPSEHKNNVEICGPKTNYKNPENISDATSILIKKLADFDSEFCRPVIKKTVKVKTYSTREGDDEPCEVIEEYDEDSEDTTLDRSEATQFLLKKIADFDGRGLTGEPFIKRTIKVKTYTTSENDDNPETVEEFEHSSDDMSLSDFIKSKYPVLSEYIAESSDILKSSDSTEPSAEATSEDAERYSEIKETEENIQKPFVDTSNENKNDIFVSSFHGGATSEEINRREEDPKSQT